MHTRNTLVRSIWMVMIAFIMVRCSTSDLPSDGKIHDTKETFQVKGRGNFLVDAKLSFGYYQTGGFKSSSTHKKADNLGIMKLLQTGTENPGKAFQFEVNDVSGLSSHVFCITHLKYQHIISGRDMNLLVRGESENTGIDVYSGNSLAVEIVNSKDTSYWKMIINKDAARNNKGFAGYLAKDRDNYYKIVPVRYTGGNEEKRVNGYIPEGYEFRNRAGQSVATVSTTGNGVVTFGAVGIREKFLMANASAAILIDQFMEN